jgi:hypothetical protein
MVALEIGGFVPAAATYTAKGDYTPVCCMAEAIIATKDHLRY